MANLPKGIWEQKNVGYTSSESDTESETEILSIYGWDKSGAVKPLTASSTALAGKGKNGSEAFRSASRVMASRKRNGEERMPTRRPDPNVLNRNALLARENRRKKKMYLESVESELYDARKANRALVKALKRQVKVSQRLEQEKRYFQNILANQSEISSLVTSLNKRRHVSIDTGSTSSLEVFTDSSNREPPTSYCSSSSYEPEPFTSPFGAASHGSVTDNGHNDFSEFLSLDFSAIPDFFTDLDTDIAGSYSHTSWDDIWNTTTQLGEEAEGTKQYHQITTLGKDNNNNNSMDDHDYVAAPATQTAFDMPSLSFSPSTESSSSLKDKDSVGDEFQGVCLHLTRGKISLEFCPTCHLNSSSRDPPLQLFNDEMLA